MILEQNPKQNQLSFIEEVSLYSVLFDNGHALNEKRDIAYTARVSTSSTCLFASLSQESLSYGGFLSIFFPPSSALCSSLKCDLIVLPVYTLCIIDNYWEYLFLTTLLSRKWESIINNRASRPFFLVLATVFRASGVIFIILTSEYRSYRELVR